MAVTEHSWRVEYSRGDRAWFLWNGRDAIRDDDGDIRFFTTAQDAYDWLAHRDERGS